MWHLPQAKIITASCTTIPHSLPQQIIYKYVARMRFSTIWFLTLPLALGGLALSDQFYLTVIPEDGSNSYPVSIAVVSRAALILSSALEYNAQFTFNEYVRCQFN